MSVSVNAFWRGLKTALRAIGLLPVDAAVSIASSSVATAQPLRLHATIELIDAPEPPDGGTPAANPLDPVYVAPARKSHTAAVYRPLAGQLAVTASRNAPKARTGKKAPVAKRPASAAFPRKATAIKAKPVVATTSVKKAPKRRHVWLSNTARVIRPIVATVVAFNAPQRGQRTAPRTATQKPVRHLKLAA